MKDSTESTTGEMPWDDIWDFSLYRKTQCKMETTVYQVIEVATIPIREEN